MLAIFQSSSTLQIRVAEERQSFHTNVIVLNMVKIKEKLSPYDNQHEEHSPFCFYVK